MGPGVQGGRILSSAGFLVLKYRLLRPHPSRPLQPSALPTESLQTLWPRIFQPPPLTTQATELTLPVSLRTDSPGNRNLLHTRQQTLRQPPLIGFYFRLRLGNFRESARHPATCAATLAPNLSGNSMVASGWVVRPPGPAAQLAHIHSSSQSVSHSSLIQELFRREVQSTATCGWLNVRQREVGLGMSPW